MYFHFCKYLQYFFSHILPRVVIHQEIQTFSLGSTKKFQEIPSNIRKTCKLQEISGNTTKYQEIQDRKHVILSRKYFVKNMKYFGIFTRLLFGLFDLSFFIAWVLNNFTLFTGDIYEMSNFMKTNFTKSGVFFKLSALKMTEITVLDVEVAVLPSFLKVLLECSAYDSFINKPGNTVKYKEIL
jgi:hypothetical protein